MNHPTLVPTLADDRRRWCPCGAVTQQPYGRAAALWWRKAARTSRLAVPNWTDARIAKAGLFARVKSLLQIIGKGMES